MDLNKLLKTQWDRAGAIGFTVLGAIFLIAGWIGVSGTALLAEQAPYIISGGVGGVFLLGIASTLWISADLRDEWRKLDRIEQAIGDGVLRWEEGPEAATSAPVPVRTRQPAPELLDTAEVPVAVAARVASNGSANGAAKPARARSSRTKASTAAAHDA